MEIQYGHERYWTTAVDDRKDGFAGVRLHQESFGKIAIRAEVLFWDAAGDITVQTFGGDVPVKIIEAAIAETKQQLPAR